MNSFRIQIRNIMKEDEKMINVLSNFNGISCGRVALDRTNLEINKYYSSEIEPNAIKIADKNYPQDIKDKLGDITKWREWNLDKIDLLIGGSPCQGLSRANVERKNLEDFRSKLFFEYYDIFKNCNPKWFLLENVKMDIESQNIISELLGVEPVAINSNLVSAQNRERLYWTNIPIKRIEDKSGFYNNMLSSNRICH